MFVTVLFSLIAAETNPEHRAAHQAQEATQHQEHITHQNEHKHRSHKVHNTHGTTNAATHRLNQKTVAPVACASPCGTRC
jgi:hypothetical protein